MVYIISQCLKMLCCIDSVIRIQWVVNLNPAYMTMVSCFYLICLSRILIFWKNCYILLLIWWTYRISGYLAFDWIPITLGLCNIQFKVAGPVWKHEIIIRILKAPEICNDFLEFDSSFHFSNACPTTIIYPDMLIKVS